MRGSRPDRSTLSRSASAAPPGARSPPAASSSRAPERLRHAGARVVRRAAADAQDEPPEPGVERVAYRLTEAVRRRRQGIAVFDGHEREARRPRHLDHRRPAVAHGAPDRRPGLAERAHHLGAAILAPGRLDQRLQGPVAAIRDRNQLGAGVRRDAANALGNHLRDPQRRDAPLERLWRNHDLHGRTPYRKPRKLYHPHPARPRMPVIPAQGDICTTVVPA